MGSTGSSTNLGTILSGVSEILFYLLPYLLPNTGELSGEEESGLS